MKAASEQIELFVSPESFFRISEVERFADDSGFVGHLSLRSGAFGLHGHRFYFDDLPGFLAQVRRLYADLSGRAELSAAYERNHLGISVDSMGHVLVSGHFERFDGESQRLDISFITDQTFLPALIRSLEVVCREVRAKV